MWTGPLENKTKKLVPSAASFKIILVSKPGNVDDANPLFSVPRGSVDMPSECCNEMISVAPVLLVLLVLREV